MRLSIFGDVTNMELLLLVPFKIGSATFCEPDLESSLGFPRPAELGQTDFSV
jgi:hypothetical protein